MANFDYDPDQPDGPFNDPGACATEAESVAEYARNVGAEHPDQEWICSPFDTWERNPFYTGKPGPHPEADNYDEQADAIANGFSCAPCPPIKAHGRVTASGFDDEIPF